MPRLKKQEAKTNWPFVSRNPAIQAAYEEMRESGESHNIAEMCACRQGPKLETDTVFTRGFATSPFGTQVTDYTAKKYMREAKSAGVSTTGKRYLSGLARYPGDPEAWVDSKGDIKRLCERRGWGCDGKVKVKARPKKNGATEKRFY